MTANFQRASAKIYQFPVKHRAVTSGYLEEAKSDMDASSSRFADAAFGGGWYHDAAVQEEERTRKH
ncbi:hypothetical protein N825_06795 [Skermanella stibiiresistens SB22]|uniref:Uncharacterized protein n=1 Tax=Skermanella stibiiresistens SB22 TaxID=1385369 RepID=W9H3U1_9PROT|nr:DUF2735 domain-containing protein [Skermanella stibiiresistens]EWY39397.1 hypothetical protein N825_06795 [Skermanella stibiiresistens SB22]